MNATAWAAPEHWRAIDFIADLHLSAAMPRTLAAWRAHLRATRADAVIVLGDLFEVWVGDDARVLPFESACIDVMREAATRLELMLMAGNRDFLIGPELAGACSARLLDDPTVIDAFGIRALLTHGDAWCVADAEYQRFRRLVRGADWQREFLALPLAQRQCIAAEIRRESASRRRFDGAADADVDATIAADALRAAGSAVLVHGHTHRPGSGPFGPTGAAGIRHVLSDWDLDRGDRAEVLRWTRDGFVRIAPEGTA